MLRSENPTRKGFTRKIEIMGQLNGSKVFREAFSYQQSAVSNQWLATQGLVPILGCPIHT